MKKVAGAKRRVGSVKYTFIPSMANGVWNEIPMANCIRVGCWIYADTLRLYIDTSLTFTIPVKLGLLNGLRFNAFWVALEKR